ncbi:MAG: hypothetical protein V4812_21115 [Pseudomonadota bacterium]
MQPGPLPLVLALALFCLASPVQAEDTSSVAPLAGATAETQLDSLEQRLAESEQARTELLAQLKAAGSDERDNAQLLRLRQDNQRLKLQLREAQAGQPPRLLSEQQRWFAIGAGVALLGTLFGALLRGKRRSRSQWAN